MCAQRRFPWHSGWRTPGTGALQLPQTQADSRGLVQPRHALWLLTKARSPPASVSGPLTYHCPHSMPSTFQCATQGPVAGGRLLTDMDWAPRHTYSTSTTPTLRIRRARQTQRMAPLRLRGHGEGPALAHLRRGSQIDSGNRAHMTPLELSRPCTVPDKERTRPWASLQQEVSWTGSSQLVCTGRGFRFVSGLCLFL